MLAGCSSIWLCHDFFNISLSLAASGVFAVGMGSGLVKGKDLLAKAHFKGILVGLDWKMSHLKD